MCISFRHADPQKLGPAPAPDRRADPLPRPHRRSLPASWGNDSRRGNALPESTAQASGVIQLVTPLTITTNFGGQNNVIPVFGVLRLHFVPEPGTALLVGGGIALLGFAGRKRRHG